MLHYRDDLAGFGFDDEVGVVVEEAVDAKAFAPRQIAVPPLNAVHVGDVVDQPTLKVPHGRLSHIQAFWYGMVILLGHENSTPC
jgi:hypothetical protein